MRASIVIATRNKRVILDRVLRSIVLQSAPDVEVIVVDDGSTDCTGEMVGCFLGVKYIRLENESYRNPCFARNAGYRAARGEIIIAQSDDVVHETPDAIERLISELETGRFCIATVWNTDGRDNRLFQYTGNEYQRPLFFLGSLYRSDLYAVGGNDEDFTLPGFEDDWFAVCLQNGRGLRPKYLDGVIGLHQEHARPDLSDAYAKMGALFREKVAAAEWCASGGPWSMESSQ